MRLQKPLRSLPTPPALSSPQKCGVDLVADQRTPEWVINCIAVIDVLALPLIAFQNSALVPVRISARVRTDAFVEGLNT
jgi:hypothetical protein